MTKPKCCYCGETFDDPTDLRPYGPGGASTCFPCAHATPERKALADQAVDAMLDAAEAASRVGEIVFTDEGPQPLDPASLVDGSVVAIRPRGADGE